MKFSNWLKSPPKMPLVNLSETKQKLKLFLTATVVIPLSMILAVLNRGKLYGWFSSKCFVNEKIQSVKNIRVSNWEIWIKNERQKLIISNNGQTWIYLTPLKIYVFTTLSMARLRYWTISKHTAHWDSKGSIEYIHINYKT